VPCWSWSCSRRGLPGRRSWRRGAWRRILLLRAFVEVEPRPASTAPIEQMRLLGAIRSQWVEGIAHRVLDDAGVASLRRELSLGCWPWNRASRMNTESMAAAVPCTSSRGALRRRDGLPTRSPETSRQALLAPKRRTAYVACRPLFLFVGIGVANRRLRAGRPRRRFQHHSHSTEAMPHLALLGAAGEKTDPLVTPGVRTLDGGASRYSSARPRKWQTGLRRRGRSLFRLGRAHRPADLDGRPKQVRGPWSRGHGAGRRGPG